MLRLLKSIVARRGKAADPHGKNTVRSRIDDALALCGTTTPTIIDGGANRGNLVKQFLRRCPAATVHAYEPIPHLAAAIRERFADRGNVHVHKLALGDAERDVSFHVTHNLDSSSVLPPNAANRATHGAAVETSSQISVRQVRLDRHLAEQRIAHLDILKLDLQGYELQALRGCGELLARTTVVLLEVEFVAMYEGQALYGDIDAFFRDRGFGLHNFYDLWTLPGGQLEAADILYVNPRLAGSAVRRAA